MLGFKHIKFDYPELGGDDLYFVVREPFKSKRTQTDICGGMIERRNNIIIESLMPNNDFIFSDEIEQDFFTVQQWRSGFQKKKSYS